MSKCDHRYEGIPCSWTRNRTPVLSLAVRHLLHYATVALNWSLAHYVNLNENFMCTTQYFYSKLSFSKMTENSSLCTFLTPENE